MAENMATTRIGHLQHVKMSHSQRSTACSSESSCMETLSGGRSLWVIWWNAATTTMTKRSLLDVWRQRPTGCNQAGGTDGITLESQTSPSNTATIRSRAPRLHINSLGEASPISTRRKHLIWPFDHKCMKKKI